MTEFDHLTDVVVVGSGSAGMVAALAARENGLESLIIESTELIGGNSAISGGGLWIPGNHIVTQKGLDSADDARTYFNWCLDNTDHPSAPGPASTPERRESFLRNGPEMVKWLEDIGMEWHYGKGYSDYYPEAPGGKPQGRGLEAKKFDSKRLGVWADKIRYSVKGIALYTTDAVKLSLATRTPKGFFGAAKAVGVDSILPMLVGKRMVGLGDSLIGRMLELVLNRTIPIWLESPMTDLIVEDGRVVGVVVEREGKQVRVGATKGVMLASGGFEKSQEMRDRYQEAPTEQAWSSGTPGNVGGPIEAAQRAGAALANMDAAWWGPTVMNPDGTAGFMLAERSMPHGIIVASDGKRFMNESESYVDAGHHQYVKNREDGVTAIPAWHIIDSHHRKNYMYGRAVAGQGTKKMVEAGFMVQAGTIEDLARKIGVDPDGLSETVRRFNVFAAKGKDEEFGRGDSAYDRFYSDPRVKPNPNLGAIDKAPYYAVKVWPGDLGTSGGVLTDEFARAVREDGSVVEGLYAAGNASASVMGYTYPGPGATIGPAMTFAYAGARHMADHS